MVLIDTSAWIWFFRTASHPLGDLVEELVRADLAAIAGPVVAELLQGVRSSKEERQLQHVFRAVPYLESTRLEWERAGRRLHLLRRQGITVPISDALIAETARSHGAKF